MKTKTTKPQTNIKWDIFPPPEMGSKDHLVLFREIGIGVLSYSDAATIISRHFERHYHRIQIAR